MIYLLPLPLLLIVIPEVKAYPYSASSPTPKVVYITFQTNTQDAFIIITLQYTLA